VNVQTTSQVPIEELLKRCSSVYKLVLLAASRAKELAEDGSRLVPPSGDYRKVTSIALEEIRQGKVFLKVEEPAAKGSGKSKGRKTKAKDDKKRVAA